MAAFQQVVEPFGVKGGTGVPTVIPGSEVPANQEWKVTGRIVNPSVDTEALVTVKFGKTADHADAFFRLDDEPLQPKQSLDFEVKTPLRELWRWFFRASISGVEISFTGEMRLVDESL